MPWVICHLNNVALHGATLEWVAASLVQSMASQAVLAAQRTAHVTPLLHEFHRMPIQSMGYTVKALHGWGQATFRVILIPLIQDTPSSQSGKVYCGLHQLKILPSLPLLLPCGTLFPPRVRQAPLPWSIEKV